MLERSVNGERESYVYDNNVVSMSKAENITWTEGYGTEVGGSLGLGCVSGYGIWVAGEATDKEDTNRFGGYVSLGAGGGAEGHVTMTCATDTFYPLQEAYDYTINLIDSVFSDSEETIPSTMAAKKLKA